MYLFKARSRARDGALGRGGGPSEYTPALRATGAWEVGVLHPSAFGPAGPLSGMAKYGLDFWSRCPGACCSQDGDDVRAGTMPLPHSPRSKLGRPPEYAEFLLRSNPPDP